MASLFWDPALARAAATALVLGLSVLPVPLQAQEATALRSGQTAREAVATPMRIVVVEWRIRKGREEEFIKYWSTQATIADRSGLISEYLSRVESREQFPWMVWDFNADWTTFVNVGLWREGADFQQQIGRFIDNSKPPMAFEADRRRRVFLAPERWRVGGSPAVETDHPEVR